MPANVTIAISTLARVQNDRLASVPRSRLTAYFEALGVSLQFEDGEILASCPCLDSRAMAAFCAERAPASGSFDSPAYLVVSAMDREGETVHGQLMDPLRRGACVVYIKSHVFQTFGDEERFEIFVHEIGHLLNLTHKPPAEDFPTAMLQWNDRRRGAGKRGALWDEAIRIARPKLRSGLSAFYGEGETRPIGLPMSGHACRFLDNAPASAVQPWGDKFSDEGPEAKNDAIAKRVICKLLLESSSLRVAQPIDFSLTLELAPGTATFDVPAVLDVRSGNVLIELEANGEVRTLRPYSRSCTSQFRRLRGDQTARRNFSIIGDHEGVALPLPGSYRLRVVVPLLFARSEWQEIDVTPGPKLLSLPDMQDFLRRGLPGAEHGNWRAIGELLDEKALPPAFSTHLALLASASKFRPLQLGLGTATESSRRIAEEAALLRVETLRASPTSQPSEIAAAIDRAEEIFSGCDSQHPSLSYLHYLRNVE